MNYQVLSRKYRPQKFDEIIGQPHIVNTLINSIENNRIAHGYLLSGLRGVGKTTAARVFSKTINCLSKNSSNPCNECQNCIEITESRSLDVIELDGASNRGIDEIREIKETVKYPPISSSYKIFIIDEVHMLTKEAFNALLKTLEEPPDNVIFILATTDPYKIPDTILSRTLKFDFKKIKDDEISKHMENILSKEEISYEKIALDAIAFRADGSVRDALSILDKIISYSHSNVSYELVKEALGIIEDKVYLNILKFIFSKNDKKLLKQVNQVIDSGYSINNFISGFNIFLSNCLIYLSGQKVNQFINSDILAWIDQNKSDLSVSVLTDIIDKIQDYELKSKYLLQPDIAFQSLFIKLAVNSSIDIELDSYEEIEEVLSNIDDKSNHKESDENVSKETEEKNNLAHNSRNDEMNNKIIEEVENQETETKIDKSNDEEKKEIEGLKNEENYEEVENSKKKTDHNLNPIDDWNKIIDFISNKDKRISSALENVELKLDNEILIIKLVDSNNSFTEKTLNDNLSFIKKCIDELTGLELEIQIVNNIIAENQEEDHPLLDIIKEKFDG